MSFDFNPIGQNLSNVQASSKTTSGGGGNTGYFQRGAQEEEEILEFPKEYPDDSFEREEIEEQEEESLISIIKNLIFSLFEAIKKLFVK